MKTALFIILTLCAIVGLSTEQAHKRNPMPNGIPVVALPDSAGDYRSAQLTSEQLETVLKSGAVDAIIRLNGDGKGDGDILSTKEEEELCRKHGVSFFRMDAHVAASRHHIVNVLNRFNALVHCRHGVHRTGAVVGQYLQQRGYRPSQIIHHLKWEDYREQWEEAYHRYFTIAITPE